MANFVADLIVDNSNTNGIANSCPFLLNIH